MFNQEPGILNDLLLKDYKRWKKRNSRHIGTKHERGTPINRTYYEPHEDT